MFDKDIKSRSSHGDLGPLCLLASGFDYLFVHGKHWPMEKLQLDCIFCFYFLFFFTWGYDLKSTLMVEGDVRSEIIVKLCWSC